MSETNNEQIPLLREMTNWLRLLGMKQLIETLESVVDSDEKKRVYQYSDGQRTTREIESLTGLGRDAVIALWKKWFLSGLGEYKTASGGHRFKRTFDLEALGLITNQKRRSQPNSSGTDESNKTNSEEIKTDE